MSRALVYNNLVTAKEWEQVNKDNKDLMIEFLEYLNSVGRSKETISQYENDLKISFVWLLNNCKNKSFIDIKKRDIIKFQGFLLNNCGMSSARIRRLRSTLSSLSNYIENFLDDEYENFKNIINKIEAPVIQPVREKTVLTFKECEKVADKLIKKGKIQLACFMMTACYSGLRKQELTRLLVKDFTNNINMSLGNSFYKTSPIKVKGKGNRIENKYVWNRVDKYLNLWLEYRKNNNIDCDYLFCRKINNQYLQLLPTSIDSFMRTLTNEFNVPIYCHNFRHVLVSELERAGLPMSVSQFLLGHSSVSITEIYNDVPKDESMEQFKNFFNGSINKVDKRKSFNDL